MLHTEVHAEGGCIEVDGAYACETCHHSRDSECYARGKTVSRLPSTDSEYSSNGEDMTPNPLPPSSPTWSNLLRFGPAGYTSKGVVLGRGSTAVVEFYSRDSDLLEVAVKTIVKKPFIRRGQLKRRVQEEVDILQAICAHRNIVEFVESREEKHCFRLVMEHLSGGGVMGGQAHEEALKSEVAVRYFCDAIAGVDHLHTHMVIHRDLKPQNMMLDGAGTLKLVDFGTAKKLNHHHEMVTGAVGTPMFTAPECFCGDTPYLGQGADVWALGVCLHQFLTGRVLFDATTLDELRGKVLHSQVELPVWLPTDLHTLMGGMLCKNAKERLTIHEILASSWSVLFT